MLSVMNSFFDFSLETYRDPQVEQSCLNLQNRLGLDVNMILLCCWRAKHMRQCLSHQTLQRLHDQTSTWQKHIVKPLRRTRRHLSSPELINTPIPAQTQTRFKKRLLETELSAERIEQELLEHICDHLESAAQGMQPPAHCATVNLRHYFHVLDLTVDTWGQEQITTLVASIFKNSPDSAPNN